MRHRDLWHAEQWIAAYHDDVSVARCALAEGLPHVTHLLRSDVRRVIATTPRSVTWRLGGCSHLKRCLDMRRSTSDHENLAAPLGESVLGYLDEMFSRIDSELWKRSISHEIPVEEHIRACRFRFDSNRNLRGRGFLGWLCLG